MHLGNLLKNKLSQEKNNFLKQNFQCNSSTFGALNIYLENKLLQMTIGIGIKEAKKEISPNLIIFWIATGNTLHEFPFNM